MDSDLNLSQSFSQVMPNQTMKLRDHDVKEAENYINRKFKEQSKALEEKIDHLEREKAEIKMEQELAKREREIAERKIKDLEYLRENPKKDINKKSVAVDTWSKQESYRISDVFEEIKVRMKECDERELKLNQQERKVLEMEEESLDIQLKSIDLEKKSADIEKKERDFIQQQLQMRQGQSKLARSMADVIKQEEALKMDQSKNESDKENLEKAQKELDVKRLKVEKDLDSLKSIKGKVNEVTTQLQTETSAQIDLVKDHHVRETMIQERKAEIERLKLSLEQKTGNLREETKKKVADILGIEVDRWGKDKQRVNELKTKGLDIFSVIKSSDSVTRGLQELTEQTNAFTMRIKQMKEGHGLNFDIPIGKEELKKKASKKKSLLQQRSVSRGK